MQSTPDDGRRADPDRDGNLRVAVTRTRPNRVLDLFDGGHVAGVAFDAGDALAVRHYFAGQITELHVDPVELLDQEPPNQQADTDDQYRVEPEGNRIHSGTVAQAPAFYNPLITVDHGCKMHTVGLANVIGRL